MGLWQWSWMCTVIRLKILRGERMRVEMSQCTKYCTILCRDWSLSDNNTALWQGCTDSCCNPAPWFYKQLSQPTTDDIKMRVCRDEVRGNPDVEMQAIDMTIIANRLLGTTEPCMVCSHCGYFKVYTTTLGARDWGVERGIMRRITKYEKNNLHVHHGNCMRIRGHNLWPYFSPTRGDSLGVRLTPQHVIMMCTVASQEF
jgi:hypothetical protein